APRTQEAYIRGCKKLAAFLRRSPDTATGEDIRLFQLHLAEQGVSICTRNRTMTGVAFLFRVTLRRPEIADQIEYIPSERSSPHSGSLTGRLKRRLPLHVGATATSCIAQFAVDRTRYPCVPSFLKLCEFAAGLPQS